MAAPSLGRQDTLGRAVAVQIVEGLRYYAFPFLPTALRRSSAKFPLLSNCATVSRAAEHQLLISPPNRRIGLQRDGIFWHYREVDK